MIRVAKYLCDTGDGVHILSWRDVLLISALVEWTEPEI